MKNSAAMKIRQLPAGYLRVGVDPHKQRHAAVVMNEHLVVQSKFKFSNSRQGFEEALGRVRAEIVKCDCRGAMLAIEAGGHYWRNLAYFLDDREVPFRLINPFSLKRRREGKDLNRRKNDFRDAEVAAELLSSGEFTETRLQQGVYAELRATYAAHRRLVKERARTINLLKGLLDSLFPEFTDVFKNVCGETALTVLWTCAVPSIIAGMTEEQFVGAVKARHPRPGLVVGKLRALHDVAETSIGIMPGSVSISGEASFLVERLRLNKEQVHNLADKLVTLVDSTREGKYLLSITGIHYISVAGLLAELGSFSSYQNSRQLIKMAGSNPTESESAGKRRNRTPMSKKGRPGLRYCAWNAAFSLLRHNDDFSAWVKKLRERPADNNPLNGREAVGAALNRLLRLAYTLVKKQTFYRSPQQLVELESSG